MVVIARTNGVAMYSPLREFNDCALPVICALNGIYAGEVAGIYAGLYSHRCNQHRSAPCVSVRPKVLINTRGPWALSKGTTSQYNVKFFPWVSIFGSSLGVSVGNYLLLAIYIFLGVTNTTQASDAFRYLFIDNLVLVHVAQHAMWALAGLA
jgi:hypothetical protein